MKGKILIYVTFLFCIIQFSCKKWIEVEPKTEIENDRFFTSAQAFDEAMNGVYLKMGTTPLYGKELTFGLTDVIGGIYSIDAGNGSFQYREAFGNNYAGIVLPIVEGIWSNSYNAIANLNNTLEQLDKSGKQFLSTDRSNVIKGEALGLRAFLHFDLLRLYAPSVAAAGLNAPGIPYAKVYKASSGSRLQVSAVIDNILSDLSEAESLLKSDPLFSSTSGNLERNLRFNYYAVKALQARVYLWKNDKVKALETAESVIAIAGSKFPFVLQTDVATGNESTVNRVFTTEHIFGLQVNKLATNYAGILDQGTDNNSLNIKFFVRNEQYETSSVGTLDYRSQYLTSNVNANGSVFYRKLYQPVGIPTQFAKRMPLIKIPEMYYIAAECLKDANGPKAVEYLNIVRRSRSITTNLSTTLSATKIQEEIRKEYWKEMPLEGQFFFYLKRVNSSSRPNDFSGITINYVFPIPVQELEFGS